MKYEVHVDATDNAGVHVSIALEFATLDAMRQALEQSVPHMLTHGTATVILNSLDWKLGIAKVQQNKMKERGDRYYKTGN